jgi:hypothetical protein
LLKDQVLSYFEHHVWKIFETEDSGDNEIIELAPRDLDLEYIPKCAIRIQKYYMRRSLCMCLNTSVKKSLESLNDINFYIFIFLENNPSS